jgi:hypothetical protein
MAATEPWLQTLSPGRCRATVHCFIEAKANSTAPTRLQMAYDGHRPRSQLLRSQKTRKKNSKGPQTRTISHEVGEFFELNSETLFKFSAL